MFKLSKKADYGLIAVKHLAMHREQHACSAGEIGYLGECRISFGSAVTPVFGERTTRSPVPAPPLREFDLPRGVRVAFFLQSPRKVELMATGTVKWFNTQKGYGFIQPDQGGKDIFVHISAVERSGIGNLREGQRLSFELERGNQGKTSAVNLRQA